MSIALRSIAILLTAATFLLLSATTPVKLRAQEGVTPSDRSYSMVDRDGKKVNCAGGTQAATGVIIGYVVPCVATSIEKGTQRFAGKMVDWLRPTFYSFLVLVVVLFGVRILQGGGQIHSEGILLLTKITLVIMFLELLPGTFVPALYNIMTETQEIVSGTLAADGSDIHCDIAKYKGPTTPIVWAHMDCALGKLYGVTTGTDPDGTKKPSMMLFSSIFGLLSGFLFGGTFGAILFLACIGVLWTLLMIIIRTASGFLNGYLYASIMLIMAPLFAPLILLKAGTEYFDRWWKSILAAILMPVIVTAYALFAMQLYDRMLFRDDSMVAKIIDPKQNTVMAQLYGQMRTICDAQTPASDGMREQATGVKASKFMKNNPFFDMIFSMLGGANNSCPFDVPKLNVEKVFNTDMKTAFVTMFRDMVFLLVTSILIALGYTNMLRLVRLMIGSGSVAATLDQQGNIEHKMSNLQHAAGQAFRGGFTDENGKSLSGTAFLTRVTEMPRRMITSINNSLGKD